ncbi:ABC transporter substrate-binding protein [Streptomyces sp. NPDC048637]|uniref:ABC transporter substrate-binding protein n=1 Tax=Streptomyces sp. NPDC048637 TaxID=3155636 RepID=UPI003419D654
MNRARFRLGTTLGIAAVLFGTSACGGLGDAPDEKSGSSPVPELKPNQKVSITFESYNFGQAGPWTDTFTALIKKFEQAHPNIKVTAQKPQGNSPNPAADAVSSVQNETASGNPPDVAQLGFGDLDYAVNGLGAKPLDDLVGKSAVRKNFAGAHPYAAKARTLGDWKGKTFGVPFVFSTPVLYYNATLFREAGLDPAKPPKTWGEVAKDALAIKKKTGKDGHYSDCLTKIATDWCWQSMVRSNGGRVLSEDRAKLTFDQPPAVEAAKTAQRMVKSGATPKLSQEQAYNEFARGGMGMILETSAIQGVFMKGAKDKWDLRATTSPGYQGKTVIPTNSGSALFVYSKDPAKQRAAWDLITFLTSDEAYTMISSKIGYLPLRTGLVDDPKGLQTWARQNPLIRPNLDQLARLEPWQSFPGKNYIQARNEMLDAVEKIVYQGADAQSTLTGARKQASKLLPTGSK